MMPGSARHHKIEPEFLGPLSDRPLVEQAKDGGPGDLYPGASAFLAARHQKARRIQFEAAKPILDRLLKPEEHIVYVAHAAQVPPTLHAVALGHFAMTYHQVLLVFTETRMIEILLGVRAKTAGTRIRSFPWAGVRELKQSFSSLKLFPAAGKKHVWKFPVRGDRRLLKLLLPRLTTRLLQEGAERAEAVPVWHCPQCAARVAATPRACDGCGATFRSSRFAALLSLSFPGAGLLYAGHPFLAAGDFLGELVLYGVFLMLMLEADPTAIAPTLAIGAFLFALTKLQSAHISQVLVARSKPETPQQRSGYSRFAVIGAIASLLVVGAAFPLAGRARPTIDRDLEVSGNQWQGSRNVAEWTAFADDDTARSQWTHPRGLRATLFAYPQRALDETGEFRTEFHKTLAGQGLDVVTDDEDVPAPFQGFRVVALGKDDDGEPIALIHYFVVDRENHDLHQVFAGVVEEDAAAAENLLRDLLSHATWTAAQPPQHPARGSGATGR